MLNWKDVLQADAFMQKDGKNFLAVPQLYKSVRNPPLTFLPGKRSHGVSEEHFKYKGTNSEPFN